MKNNFGLDVSYFEKKLKLLVRDIKDYSPAELQNELLRMAKAAGADVSKFLVD